MVVVKQNIRNGTERRLVSTLKVFFSFLLKTWTKKLMFIQSSNKSDKSSDKSTSLALNVPTRESYISLGTNALSFISVSN